MVPTIYTTVLYTENKNTQSHTTTNFVQKNTIIIIKSTTYIFRIKSQMQENKYKF